MPGRGFARRHSFAGDLKDPMEVLCLKSGQPTTFSRLLDRKVEPRALSRRVQSHYPLAFFPRWLR